MRTLRVSLVTLVLGVGILLALSGTSSAISFSVITTPYHVNHTLPDDAAWNTYELTATDGQSVRYSMTITTPGACALLLFVKGHNPGPQFEYFATYSEGECVDSYSNSFPVEPSDGTTFSVLIVTGYAGDVNYSLDIDIIAPLVPDWVLAIGVVAILGILPVLIGWTWRRWREGPVPPLPAPSSPRDPP